jgi:hypothetical protein
MTSRRLPLVLLVALSTGGCQTVRVGETRSFEEAVRTYAVADDKKALAVAADEHGNRVWGAQYGSWTQERANREAMSECEANARSAGVQAQCYLFAIGGKPSRTTLDRCQSKRINPARCALQDRYGPLLTP